MDFFNRKVKFMNIYRKEYRNVPEANHCSLTYQNKYKLGNHYELYKKPVEKS